MMKFMEVLKASKGLPVRDSLAALWGQKIGEDINWKVIEITGTLPLTFLSNGGDLVDYRIYGTAEGAGVETENLWGNFIITNKFITASGKELVSEDLRFEMLQCDTQPNRSYNMSWETTVKGGDDTPPYIRVSFYNGTEFISRTLFDCSAATNNIIMFDTPNDCNKVDIRIDSDQSSQGQHITNTMLCEGTVLPDGYIPYGYKLPLTVESGETENLILEYLDSAYVKSDGAIAYNAAYDLALVEIENGKIYSVRPQWSSGNVVYGFFMQKPQLGSISYDSSRAVHNSTTPFSFTAPITGWVAMWSSNASEDKHKLTIVEGSTPPDHYIPHRYTSDIPIYIGDSKLGGEEYVDYGEQKIYKMSEGTLVPTDPPVPLPPIPTYKGENTLSSTEQLGEVTIIGRIKAIP